MRTTGKIHKPRWLTNRTASAKWRELAGPLQEAGYLCPTDAGALARYCDLWASYVRMSRHLEKHGDIITATNKQGATYTAQHPYVKERRQLSTELARLESRFALDPSSRGAVATNGTTPRLGTDSPGLTIIRPRQPATPPATGDPR